MAALAVDRGSAAERAGGFVRRLMFIAAASMERFCWEVGTGCPADSVACG